MDRERVWRLIDRVTGFGAGLTTIGLLALADRTGILQAMAAAGPADASSLADRAGVDRRYAQEILSGLAVAEVLDYDAGASSYSLPDEHAAVVADDNSPYSLAGYLDLLPAMMQRLEELAEAVRSGGGVPFSEFGERAVQGVERANSPGTRILLARRWLAAVPEVVEKLERGGKVADVGCGTGTAALTMGEAYPNSEVIGLDIDRPSIERAERRLRDSSLTNVTFVVGSAESLQGGFDLITAFDVIHDMANPLGALKAIRSALAADGVLVMMEPNVSADLEDDIGDDRAALVYGMSTMFCLTQSLAQGGAGLGAAWGPRRAEELCREAGFSDFVRLPIDNPFSAFYRVS